MSKKYRTRLIDEATYYALKGFKYKVETLGYKGGEWIFDLTPDLEKARKVFFCGNPIISVHKWLFVRNQLKYEQAKTPVSSSNKKAKKNVPLLNGETYYYVGDDLCVHGSYYGQADIHKKRIKDKNFFLTREEAEASIPL